MRSRGTSRFTASGVISTVVIAGLAVLTVLLCVLAVQHTREPSTPTSASTTLTAPSSEPSAPSPSVAEEAPAVSDQRRADFSAGDPLPDGSQIFDSSTASEMVLRDGELTHGGPAEAAAASYLETRLSSDVAKLGARVVFAGGSSGSIALVASPESVVEAGRAGDLMPESGMRLVVGPAGWKLVSGNDRQVVAQGDFDAVAGQPLTVQVVRDGARVWVSDPSGQTSVEDPAAADLAGPWACWALLETDPGQQPAALQAVWAG